MTWSPDLGAERVYRVLGAKGLGDAAAEDGSRYGLADVQRMAPWRSHFGV